MRHRVAIKEETTMQRVFPFSAFVRRALAAVSALLACAQASALIDYPGRIDDTFGNNPENFASTRLGTVGANLSAIALQPDGKILIGGRCNTATAGVFQICVGRLTAAGMPDSTYGSGGAYRLSESGFSGSYGGFLAARADGSVYVAGACGDTAATNRLCLARLDPNGNKDTSFGNAGFVELTGYNGDPKAVMIRKSGKVIVLGECSLAICIVQLSETGTIETGLRTTWGSLSGISTFRPISIAEEANNRLAIAGTCITVNSEIRGCAVRYYPLDGISGGTDPLRFPYVWNTTEQSEGNALAIAPDGAWLLAGACQVSAVRRFCVRRLLPTGALDATFATAGAAALPFTGLDNVAQAIALQPDGKILMNGTCRTASSTESVYCSVRLQQDGRYDTSYGFFRDGRELTTLDSFGAFVSATTLQRDGQLLVGGASGEMRVFRLRGGWFGARQCDFDVDGDNIPATSNDILLSTRAAMGFTGSALLQGATFAAHASRTSAPAIRDYLISQCGMFLQP
jgi:uncharacterized delta-60 repeat protein